MTTGAVLDVRDDTFKAEVLDRSHETAVVVDFWAPWCGPCQVLGPTLERLAEEHAGRVRLVKVNIDENRIAGQLGIKSIPHVMAFKNGKLADQFVGAVPEPTVRGFFEGLLPSMADLEVERGEAARAAGDLDGARERLEAALSLDADHERATVGLASVLLAQGDIERAASVIAPLAEYTKDPDARRLAGEIRMRLASNGTDRAALEARLAANEDDAEAHYRLGVTLAASGDWEPALEHLLDAVRLDRSVDDDGARQRMLEAFDVLGNEHPLTRRFRSRLANVLF